MRYLLFAISFLFSFSVLATEQPVRLTHELADIEQVANGSQIKYRLQLENLTHEHFSHVKLHYVDVATSSLSNTLSKRFRFLAAGASKYRFFSISSALNTDDIMANSILLFHMTAINSSGQKVNYLLRSEEVQ